MDDVPLLKIKPIESFIVLGKLTHTQHHKNAPESFLFAFLARFILLPYIKSNAKIGNRLPIEKEDDCSRKNQTAKARQLSS
ncbi:hypothetical protein ACXOIF_005155 [Escherichia coli]